MKRRIASEEHILDALKKVIREYKIVRSQKRLKELVSDYLINKNNVYLVSERRLRRTAARADFIEIEIHAREGKIVQEPLETCPVCGEKLKKIKSPTIWGDKATFIYRCKICGYKTGARRRIPTRYIFHLKGQ